MWQNATKPQVAESCFYNNYRRVVLPTRCLVFGGGRGWSWKGETISGLTILGVFSCFFYHMDTPNTALSFDIIRFYSIRL